MFPALFVSIIISAIVLNMIIASDIIAKVLIILKIN